MKTFIRKLTSRKLWAAIAGFTTGVATMLGAGGNTIDTISGAVVALGSVAMYIFAEGKIDAARVAAAAQAAETIVTAIENEPEETEDEASELEDGNAC